jgi:putative transcriptional regulator
MITEINHHPDDATLLSYAAGTLAEALTAVVAAHVSMCPRCRAEVADLNLLGSTLMLSSVGSGGVLTAPRYTDGKSQVKTPTATGDARLPPSIAKAFGLAFDDIPWKRLGPGVWHHPLSLSAGEAGDLRLLRIGPGRRMPNHGHAGAELTLVIDGEYSDVTGRYRRGDIQDVDEGIEHQPIVDMASECVCLIASERPARFKSFLGRLIQPWTGM